MQVKTLALDLRHSKYSVNVSYYYYYIPFFFPVNFFQYSWGISKEVTSSITFCQHDKKTPMETAACTVGSRQKQNKGKCLVVILVPNDVLQGFEVPSESVKKDYTEADNRGFSLFTLFIFLMVKPRLW